LNSLTFAQNHYLAAMALWPEDDPEWPALVVETADISLGTYGDEVTRAVVRARDRLVAVGDLGNAAKAEMLVGFRFWNEAMSEESMAAFSRAGQLLEGAEAKPTVFDESHAGLVPRQLFVATSAPVPPKAHSAGSQAAAYGSLPTKGKVFVSVANRDKRAMLFPIKRLHDLGVRMRTNLRLVGASPGSVTFHNEFAEQVGIETDSLVLVVQRRSDDRLFHELRESPDDLADAGIRNVLRVGDCIAPRELGYVILDGHRLAREIDSPTPQAPQWPRREVDTRFDTATFAFDPAGNLLEA